ncbi:MAG TPA: RDD family protein [Jiangellaceae bacterium]|nr:RDD family protein [Jiangellaceae bacterium]
MTSAERGTDRSRHKLSPIPHQARRYQGRRAGLVTRTVAAAVDAVVVAGLVGAIYLAWSALLFTLDPPSFTFPDVPILGWLGGAYVLAVGYLTLGWATAGLTVGARLMGLRVVNHRGAHLRPAGALLRAVFCAIFPIGLAWIAVSPSNRSVQDTVLRTSVVYDWQPGHDRSA